MKFDVSENSVGKLTALLEPLDLNGRLTALAKLFPHGVKFSSSLGMEDQVITDSIARHSLDIQIFTLETGRLFEETLDVLESTRRSYGLPIRVVFPNAIELEGLVASQGVVGFYESVQNRKECCRVRKVNPLRRALQGAEVWVTGLRQEQSLGRESLPLVQWDSDLQLLKVNPMREWPWDAVVECVERFNIPVNRLHGKGYPSIGCAPCTRAVKPGQDPRSGRWWWEQEGSQECGLHLNKKG